MSSAQLRLRDVLSRARALKFPKQVCHSTGKGTPLTFTVSLYQWQHDSAKLGGLHIFSRQGHKSSYSLIHKSII